MISFICKTAAFAALGAAVEEHARKHREASAVLESTAHSDAADGEDLRIREQEYKDGLDATLGLIRKPTPKVSLGYLKARQCTQRPKLMISDEVSDEVSGQGECQEPDANPPMVEMVTSLIAEKPDVWGMFTCDHKFRAGGKFDPVAFRKWYGEERLAEYEIRGSTTADADVGADVGATDGPDGLIQAASRSGTTSEPSEKTTGVRFVVGYKTEGLNGVTVATPKLMSWLPQIRQKEKTGEVFEIDDHKNLQKSIFISKVTIPNGEDFSIVGANFGARAADRKTLAVDFKEQNKQEDGQQLRFAMIGDFNIRNRADPALQKKMTHGAIQSWSAVLNAIRMPISMPQYLELTNPFYRTPVDAQDTDPTIGRDEVLEEFMDFVAPVKIEDSEIVGPLASTYKRHPMCNQTLLERIVDEDFGKDEYFSNMDEKVLIDCFFRDHDPKKNSNLEDFAPRCDKIMAPGAVEDPSKQMKDSGCLISTAYDSDGKPAVQVGHLDRLAFSKAGWTGVSVTKQKTYASAGDHAALVVSFLVADIEDN